MWLRLFHFLGLTNLSDQQVESYYVGRSDYLNTIVGKGSSLEGKLNVQGILRVYGRVKGDVSISDSLLVSKNGELDAEIRVRNAIIAGKVKGTLVASGKVVLENNSVVVGVLKTPKLVIDEGAVFDGSCSMVDNPGIETKIEYDKSFSERCQSKVISNKVT